MPDSFLDSKMIFSQSPLKSKHSFSVRVIATTNSKILAIRAIIVLLSTVAAEVLMIFRQNTLIISHMMAHTLVFIFSRSS